MMNQREAWTETLTSQQMSHKSDNKDEEMADLQDAVYIELTI